MNLPATLKLKVKRGEHIDLAKLKCQAKVPSSRNFFKVKYKSDATLRVLSVFVCRECSSTTKNK
jgi:hypothetical protein